MSSTFVQLFTALQLAGLKVCTLLSALKSKMAAIFMETNDGEKIIFYFFSIIFHTDHNTYMYTIKLVGLKMIKTVFRQLIR